MMGCHAMQDRIARLTKSLSRIEYKWPLALHEMGIGLTLSSERCVTEKGSVALAAL